MNNIVWLWCDVLSEEGNIVNIQSEWFDGTKFSLQVRNTLTEITDDRRHCWLQVESHGESNDRFNITLPQAILEQGSQVTVKSGRVSRNKNIPQPQVTKGVNTSIIPARIIRHSSMPVIKNKR